LSQNGLNLFRSSVLAVNYGEHLFPAAFSLFVFYVCGFCFLCRMWETLSGDSWFVHVAVAADNNKDAFTA
jgi:hypothetical protein